MRIPVFSSLPSHIARVMHLSRQVYFQSRIFPSRIISITHLYHHIYFQSSILPVTYFPVTIHFSHHHFYHVYFQSRIFPSRIISVCIFTVTYISRHLLFPTRILPVTYFRHASFLPHIYNFLSRIAPITYISRQVSLLWRNNGGCNCDWIFTGSKTKLKRNRPFRNLSTAFQWIANVLWDVQFILERR